MKSEVDDWLSELPPLDGADDEPSPDEAGVEDDLPPGVEGEASLDDATADDLDVDDGLDTLDDEALGDDEDDAWEADVGEAELDLADEDDGDAADGEASGIGETDSDLDDDLPISDDDAGEEGTTDAIEQAIEEDLPALDADDEGDFEDALMLEPGFGAPPRASIEWADSPWVRAVNDERVVRFAPSEEDPVVAMSLCVVSSRLVSVAVAARLHVESARGEDISTSDVAKPLLGGASSLLALGSREGGVILWAATRSGEVAKSVDLGVTWSEGARLPGKIVALTTDDEGALVALSRDATGFMLLQSVDGAKWTKDRVALDPSFDKKPWLAVGAGSVAVGDAHAVFVRRHGQPFVRVARSIGASAGVFAGVSRDAPLVLAAVGGAGDGGAHLVRVATDGALEIVAELAVDDDDEHVDTSIVYALAWDDRTQKLWASTTTRIFAFASRITNH